LILVNATIGMATAQLVPLAKELDENKVTPGVLGFIVFALIGGALWLLMKSMTKQLKRVDFVEDPDPAPAAKPATPGPAAQA
jgi:hypothetical protein